MTTRSSASDPWLAAQRLLAVRDRSEGELRERLGRKGFGEEQIEKALARGRELGYLDDARFALGRARALLQSGRAVGPRLLADLRSRGIDETTARAACEEAAREQDLQTLIGELRQRRFPDFDFDRAPERARARVVNFFLRRGFPLAQVLTNMRKER